MKDKNYNSIPLKKNQEYYQLKQHMVKTVFFFLGGGGEQGGGNHQSPSSVIAGVFGPYLIFG